MHVDTRVVDFYNSSEAQIAAKMHDLFYIDYTKSGDISHYQPFDIEIAKEEQEREQYHFITVDNKIIGFNSLKAFARPTDGTICAYISEVIYIDPEYRNLGIATQVRHIMRQKYRILGSSMSIKRIRKNVKYLKQNGFQYLYYHMNQAFSSEGVHLVAYELLDPGFVAEYPFKVKLNNESINNLYSLARRYVKSGVHFINMEYINKIYMKA